MPRPRLAEMVDRIDAIAHAHDVPVATFGHAGDGNLHPTIVVDQHDDAAIKRAHEAFGEMFQAAIEMDGTITGEHGVGAAKLPYLTDRLGADQMALLRRIKAAFDPAGILNPGKTGLMTAVDPKKPGAGDRRSRQPRHRGPRTCRARRQHLRPAAARPLHLLRVLPARLPDLRADQGRGLLAPWADHADAGAGDRAAGPGRRPAAEGGVVLPGLPGLRAGVPGGGAVRAPAGDLARPPVARPAPPAAGAGADDGRRPQAAGPPDRRGPPARQDPRVRRREACAPPASGAPPPTAGHRGRSSSR